jgi:hypothetical protein
MFSKPLKVTALALVSLGAACTSSEPVKFGIDSGGGATGAAPAPFKPYTPPVVDEPPPVTIPPAEPAGAGSGGSITGSGGAAGQAAGGCVALSPTMPPPAGVAPPFPLDLGSEVTQQQHAPRPISGGTLLVLRDGATAVASDPDFDRIYVVDLTLRAVRATLLLDAGDEPGRLVEDDAGLVHVALRTAGQIVTVDPALGAIVGRHGGCAAPRGLAYEAKRDLVHVACADGRLVSLRAKDGTRFRDMPIDRDVRDVVSLADGGLLVSTFKRAEALVVDVDGRVAGTPRRPPTVTRLPAPVPAQMSPGVAWRMVADQSGGAVMLHQRGVDGTVSPTPGGYGGGGKGCGGIVESVVTVVAPGQDMAPAPAVQMSTLAVDVALSPDGTQLAIASAGNAHTPLPQVQLVSLSQVVNAPSGFCMGGIGAATAPGEGQAVAVSFAADGALYVQTREPARLWSNRGGEAITLSDDTRADTGHLIFHANAGGGIACASCHPEGGEDGRTWNFACLGPRRTQSLRGRLSETAPFHWDGDMKNVHQLVNEVFVGRMSGPKTTTTQDDALLNWLDGVPDLPAVQSGTSAAAQRGRDLFEGKAKCATCHAGSHLTNNVTVDVGTGAALQVPSLRGVGWRAPFLHDGRAPTLADRFKPMGGGDRHGETSQLEPADIADLTTYLESL